MRKLFYAVFVLAALWAGYWAIGAWALQRGVAAWVGEQRAAGLTLDYADLSLRGFPSRFDLTVTEPRYADPRSGAGWEAPFFQVFALSYKPTHLIAVWPHEQVVTLPSGPVRVTSSDMRASAVFVPGPSLALDRSTLVAQAVAFGGGEGWAADGFRFATRRAAGSERGHDVGIEAQALRLPERLRRALDPQARLPAAVARVHLDATTDFDRPIDRHVLETPPGVTGIDLRDLSAEWGPLKLRITGRLAPDDAGFAEGELTVRIENWRGLVDLAENAGLLPQENRRMAETMLGLLAQGDVLEAPLTFAGGGVAFGPIPLGAAPRLRLP